MMVVARKNRLSVNDKKQTLLETFFLAYSYFEIVGV